MYAMGMYIVHVLYCMYVPYMVNNTVVCCMVVVPYTYCTYTVHCICMYNSSLPAIVHMYILFLQRLTCLQMGTSHTRTGILNSEEEGRAYLRQWKVAAEAKLDQLQGEVERRVPREELDVLEEQYRVLSGKYQELVQRQCLLAGRAEMAERSTSQEVREGWGEGWGGGGGGGGRSTTR